MIAALLLYAFKYRILVNAAHPTSHFTNIFKGIFSFNVLETGAFKFLRSLFLALIDLNAVVHPYIIHSLLSS
jgi:hypothetical protein